MVEVATTECGATSLSKSLKRGRIQERCEDDSAKVDAAPEDTVVAVNGHTGENGGGQENGEWHNDGHWEEVPEPWYIDAHDLVLEPAGSGVHKFTVILLHSCSGGPDDAIAFFHRLNLQFRNSIRMVVPCSPIRCENHYGWEHPMNSWFEYDNNSEDGNALKDVDQLLEQRSRLLQLLDKERRRLPNSESSDPRRLVLWGLSQGAGLAIDVALHAPFVVGGVIALRGMALRDGLEDVPQRTPNSQSLNLLAINGDRDWLCPPNVARVTYEALSKYGVNVDFNSEPSLGHAAARGRQKLNGPELRRVNNFLRQVWDGLA